MPRSDRGKQNKFSYNGGHEYRYTMDDDYSLELYDNKPLPIFKERVELLRKINKAEGFGLDGESIEVLARITVFSLKHFYQVVDQLWALTFRVCGSNWTADKINKYFSERIWEAAQSGLVSRKYCQTRIITDN